ncbi:MAG: UrcA family protein [Proteobacteria bacterium]|nr:UrcA family protein [Pseudomonadota bacterium]
MKTLNVIPSRAALYAFLSACVIVSAGAAAHAGEACAVAAPAPHAAGTAVTVRFADLDVSTRDGASALYGRITHAARQVCDNGDIRDLTARAAAASCEREAVAQAVHTVHSPQLAALIDAKPPQG